MSNNQTDPAILQTIAQRHISKVLHFTTSRGLIGILAQRRVQGRTHLGDDKYLEHIYRPNSNYRREAPEYWRYINLSVSGVNSNFFSISRGWHSSDKYLHWVVLGFDPTIAAHPGVLFASGNMAYDGITATPGSSAFDALFDPTVPSGFGKHRSRAMNTPTAHPSNPQAEVLYPDSLPTAHLTAIYVASDEDAANVEGILGTLDHPDVPVVVATHMFQG